LGLISVPAEPASADSYCNPSHGSWDPCYKKSDSTAEKKDSGRKLPDAACENLDLRVRADIGEQTCRAASVSDADARARAEIVNAMGAGTIFLAEYINAGIRTYVYRSTPSDVAEQTGLEQAAGEPESRFEMKKFDVWRFKGTVGMYCTAFVKHWGHVPQTPGYRHRIVGIYCSQRAADIADAHLDEVLASIEPG
jgi:hypothetical protein